MSLKQNDIFYESKKEALNEKNSKSKAIKNKKGVRDQYTLHKSVKFAHRNTSKLLD